MPPSTLFIVPHFITHIYKKRAFSVCVLKSLFDILFDIDSVNGAKALISFWNSYLYIEKTEIEDQSFGKK